MYKMIIQLDSDKINSQSKYTEDTISKKLDEIFFKRGFTLFLDGKRRNYCGSENENDFARMGIILNGLRKQTWFVENVSEWLLCNNEDGVDEMDFTEENLVEHLGLH